MTRAIEAAPERLALEEVRPPSLPGWVRTHDLRVAERRFTAEFLVAASEADYENRTRRGLTAALAYLDGVARWVP